MSRLMEQYLPPVNEDGIVTNKNATFGGTVTFNGAQIRSGNILGSSGNTTLTAAQSGATLLFDTAAGITYTLPAPVVGLEYTFIVQTTVTSASHKVITNSASVFMLGIVALMEASAATALGALADGAASRAITMNGTTTGGILGTKFTLIALSATQWSLSGIVAGSGSLSTPITTS